MDNENQMKNTFNHLGLPNEIIKIILDYSKLNSKCNNCSDKIQNKDLKYTIRNGIYYDINGLLCKNCLWWDVC